MEYASCRHPHLIVDENDYNSIEESTFAAAPMEFTSTGGRNKLKKPRIMKTDTRRFFGVMLANVFNSTNPQLLNDFVYTYCHPEQFSFSQLSQHLRYSHTQGICNGSIRSNCLPPIEYQQQLLASISSSSPLLVGHYVKLSIQNFILYSQLHMVDTPDIVFKLGKMIYKLRSDNSGTVYFQCSLTGSRSIGIENRQSAAFDQLFQERSVRVQEIHYPSENDKKKPEKRKRKADIPSTADDVIDITTEFHQAGGPFFNPFEDNYFQPSYPIVDMYNNVHQQNLSSLRELSNEASEHSLLQLFAIQGIMVVHFDQLSRINEITFQFLDFAASIPSSHSLIV